MCRPCPGETLSLLLHKNVAHPKVIGGSLFDLKAVLRVKLSIYLKLYLYVCIYTNVEMQNVRSPNQLVIKSGNLPFLVTINIGRRKKPVLQSLSVHCTVCSLGQKTSTS